MEKNLNIKYQLFSSVEELDNKDAELLQKAIDASGSSYSPYSSYPVGAAVRLSDGSIILGSNQENAAYPSGLCAERTAIFAAHANRPSSGIETIAIVACRNGNLNDIPAFPCGACRQVMAESQKRSGHPVRIIVAGASEIYIFPSVESLLPFVFEGV